MAWLVVFVLIIWEIQASFIRFLRKRQIMQSNHNGRSKFDIRNRINQFYTKI